MPSSSDTVLTAYGRASLQPALVNQMMADCAGDFRDDIDINLGIGYVNERTIPNAGIAETLNAVLRRRRKCRAALDRLGPRRRQILASFTLLP